MLQLFQHVIIQAFHFCSTKLRENIPEGWPPASRHNFANFKKTKHVARFDGFQSCFFASTFLQQYQKKSNKDDKWELLQNKMLLWLVHMYIFSILRELSCDMAFIVQTTNTVKNCWQHLAPRQTNFPQHTIKWDTFCFVLLQKEPCVLRARQHKTDRHPHNWVAQVPF